MLKRSLTIFIALIIAACDQQAPTQPTFTDTFSAPDYLAEHAKLSTEAVRKVDGAPIWQYANINGGIPNIIVIEGETGLIIVDTNISMENSTRAMTMIRQRTDKPVKAVIYTHHHADHVGGAEAFVSTKDAREGTVPVIASTHFLKEMQDENAVTAQIMGIRALYMYGVLLDPETDGQIYHVGIGGHVRPGTNGYVEPNTFVDGMLDITLDGIEMQIFETGGEAASHIGVYLPAYGAILSGDEIQGPTFPNLHSLRGTKPRDAEKWITAIDRMRAYKPRVLIPSHGPVVEGVGDVEHLLKTYRDAIQWTHDQAIRLINAGYTGEEIANILTELPDHLSIDPWTKEMYGTVRHSVRSYYTSYISWFDGDATTLSPTPPADRAGRTVALMGGRDNVLAEASRVLEAGDPQWAAELATHLIRINRDDSDARALKARALRQIGYATLNTNWRGFYLTAARELEGLVDTVALQNSLRGNFPAASLSSGKLLSLMRYRLVPAEAEGKALKIGFSFPDTSEDFTLELRNEILVLSEGRAEDLDATVVMNRADYNDLILQKLSFGKALLNGTVRIEGSKLDAVSFFGSFDLETRPIELTVR